MISRPDLQTYLDKYLACDTIRDYAPNGLQLEGRFSIQKIATAVTASLDVIEAAFAAKADALIVHHGYFWQGEAPVITGIKHKRVAKMLAHDINLFAYHLPLDCHKEIGNNICLGKIFELERIQSHFANKTADLLWSGDVKKPLSGDFFSQFLAQQLGRVPLWVSGNEKPIRRVFWCSGAAQDLIEQAALMGADAYVSGEISERTYYQAKELGIHYFAAGHHATERYGIQALGEHITSKFGLEHIFIDSDNPV